MLRHVNWIKQSSDSTLAYSVNAVVPSIADLDLCPAFSQLDPTLTQLGFNPYPCRL